MFGFCFSRLGSREEAEDAVQSTFLNAHRALQRGVTPEAELAWLLKIAHNVCLTRRRSTRRRGRVEAASDIDSMQDYLPAPAQESTEELIRLDDALAQMPESQRRAIVLREWQGLSYAEIARELKVTQSAVETLIFRARRSLATNLETVFERPRVLARARHAVELGWLLNALRALFEGGAAVKAATAAVAISSATVLATSTGDAPRHAKKASAPTPVAVVEHPVAIAERPRLAERELMVASTTEASRPSTHRQRAAKPSAVAAADGVSAKTPKEKKVKPHARGAERAKPVHKAKVRREKTVRVSPHPARTPRRTKPKKHAPSHAAAPAPATAKPASEGPAPAAKNKHSGKSK